VSLVVYPSDRRRSHYHAAMLQVLIGGALSIVGGFLAAWWQTNRADDVARDIRRDERRERGLLELNAAVSRTHAQLDPLYRQAQRGQTPFQYQESIRVMSELAQHWESNAVGVIPDQDVVDAYTAVAVAVRDGLPAGSSYASYIASLQSGDNDAARRFVRDLGHVLGLLDDLKKVVQQKVKDLNGKASLGRQLSHGKSGLQVALTAETGQDERVSPAKVRTVS
jgi:hypothetical protein